MTSLTHRFERAFLYASQVHGGQLRKGTDTPYIAHLMAVAATVIEYGGGEDQAVAALLHDAAEDHGGLARLADIEARFGERVARIVEHLSDNIIDGREDLLSWKERKQAYLQALKTHPEESVLVSLADKVHNARATLRDLRNPGVGNNVWDRFRRPREETLWYYNALAEIFLVRCGGDKATRQLAEELRSIVDILEREPSS